MASTAHKTKKEYVEHFDKPDVLERKVELLASWIRESNHAIAFTGAGISTSAGIADFRSGMDTCLKTGAGAWTLRANKKKASAKAMRTSTLSAIPTETHMSLVKLHKAGLLQHVVSQNCDGLHRRSGLPPNALSELHGNTNLERCSKCGYEYLRDGRVRNARHVHDHKTGRKCTRSGCGGSLEDTIINFGENLPEVTLQTALQHACFADVCLAMGSSLRVTPAADIPDLVAERGNKLVIVNLQSTPLDNVAALRINGKVDDVMRMLMQKLGQEIPPFQLTRHVEIKEIAHKESPRVKVYGVDSDGTPFTLLKKVDTRFRDVHDRTKVRPWTTHLDQSFSANKVAQAPKKLDVTLSFVGHYREPPLTVSHMFGVRECTRYQLRFNPRTGRWKAPLLVGDKKEDDDDEEKPPARDPEEHEEEFKRKLHVMVEMGFDKKAASAALATAGLDLAQAAQALAATN